MSKIDGFSHDRRPVDRFYSNFCTVPGCGEPTMGAFFCAECQKERAHKKRIHKCATRSCRYCY